jgi:hypothetical protein
MAKYPRNRHNRARGTEAPGLERCIAGISYPVTWQAHSATSAIGNAFRHQQHRQAAEIYACRYHASRGKLPSGTHHVVLEAKPGRWAAFEGDITYPD